MEGKCYDSLWTQTETISGIYCFCKFSTHQKWPNYTNMLARSKSSLWIEDGANCIIYFHYNTYPLASLSQDPPLKR